MNRTLAWIAIGLALSATACHAGLMGALRMFPNERSFGQFGTEAGEFRTPTGIALSPDGFLYVTDYKNNTVLKYDEDGKFTGQVMPGDVPFDAPVGIAFDSKKNLYVVEEKGCRVRKFDAKGSLIATYGGPGPETGKFRGPRGIAVGPHDEVYIADYDNHRIQEFNSGFAWVRNLRIRDNGRRPASPRGLAIDREGHLWCCFSNIHKIARFDQQGNTDLVIGEEGQGLSQFEEPRYIAFDVQNHFYVTDTMNGRVQRFNTKGEFEFSVGVKGAGRSQFRGPQGIAVDLKGNVYVADSDNFRVQVLFVNDVIADLNFAHYYDSVKQWDKALDLYQKVLKKVPLHQESIERIVAISLTRAEEIRQTDQLDRAKPYLEEVLRLEPSNTKALQFQRFILWKNNKGMIYYLTLGTGIFFTFIFLVTTMVKILTSD